MNNLDVYLMPAGSDDLAIDSIWSSRTSEDNVEHIFFSNFPAGAYKIVVDHSTVGTLGTSQNYALAWWYGSDVQTAPPGDFNSDGKVDTADYVVWRKDPASYGGAGGYTTWRSNYGTGSGSGSGSSLASVPEPSAICLTFVGMLICIAKRRRA